MENTLRELVDALPTQSLELYVQHYEAGEVGGFYSEGCPRSANRYQGGELCPRAALGFDCVPHGRGAPSWIDGAAESNLPTDRRDHAAGRIERMAAGDRLDTAELYSECILAIQERDAAIEAAKEAHKPALTHA